VAGASGRIHHEVRSTKKDEERHPLISLITQIVRRRRRKK